MESRDRDRLDQWLERALHEYGSAEPRVGLESRILANVAGQEAKVADRQRWWPAIGTATAIAAVVIAVWLGSGVNDRSKSIGNSAYNASSTKHEASTQPVAKHATAKAAIQRRWRPHHATAVELAESPKLSQFPSLQPLSEQEIILVRYTKQFHQHAVGIARASTELLEREASLLATPEQLENLRDSEK
jgi:hypothetical protein